SHRVHRGLEQWCSKIAAARKAKSAYHVTNHVVKLASRRVYPGGDEPRRSLDDQCARLVRKKSVSSLREITDELFREEETLRQGGGADGQERQRRLGRLNARER